MTIRPKYFWSRVQIGDRNECWPWTKALGRKGYGQFGFKDQHRWRCARAHRVAWVLTYGAIPDGMLVCHHCDNPCCCNPLHLFVGTAKQNTGDARRKGRLRGAPKLNEFQVRVIRHLIRVGKIMQVEIAQAFSISKQEICNIKKGRRWPEVTS